jgi:uncharacterized protein (DUF362 family)
MSKVVLHSLSSKSFSDFAIDSAVEKAVDSLNYDFTRKIDSVVIKPNLCYYWDASTGETTDPRLVSAVIDYIRMKIGNDVKITVAEADASAMKTRYAFRILGYDKLCEKKNVQLVNLSEGEIIQKQVKVNGRELKLPVNDILLKADLIINVPKLKSHNFVGITCALKNIFGAISKPRKYSYHEIISDVIVGVNKIVKSDLVIVDGLIVHGSGTKKLGAILASNDPLANDLKAAEIMGFNPKKVPYLTLAIKEKIGQVNKIELIESNIRLKDLKKQFPHQNHLIHKISWDLQLKSIQIYAKLTDDVIPPFLVK